MRWRRPGPPRRRRPLGGCADTARSKSTGDTAASARTPTTRPAPTRRRVAPGRASCSREGAAGTFFKPRSQRIARNPKHAADGAHRHPLLVGLQHMFLKRRRMRRRSGTLNKSAPTTLASVALLARNCKTKFH